jgi:hypothetical protein
VHLAVHVSGELQLLCGLAIKFIMLTLLLSDSDLLLVLSAGPPYPSYGADESQCYLRWYVWVLFQ